LTATSLLCQHYDYFLELVLKKSETFLHLNFFGFFEDEIIESTQLVQYFDPLPLVQIFVHFGLDALFQILVGLLDHIFDTFDHLFINFFILVCPHQLADFRQSVPFFVDFSG